MSRLIFWCIQLFGGDAIECLGEIHTGELRSHGWGAIISAIALNLFRKRLMTHGCGERRKHRIKVENS